MLNNVARYRESRDVSISDNSDLGIRLLNEPLSFFSLKCRVTRNRITPGHRLNYLVNRQNVQQTMYYKWKRCSNCVDNYNSLPLLIRLLGKKEKKRRSLFLFELEAAEFIRETLLIIISFAIINNLSESQSLNCVSVYIKKHICAHVKKPWVY